jgi:hypothetical protein
MSDFDNQPPHQHIHRNRQQRPLPRRLTKNPRSPRYTCVIRLEGQVLTLIQILRFRLRHSRYPPDNSLAILIWGPLNAYFTMIDQLVAACLDNGLDMNGARSADNLIRRVAWYVDQVSEEDNEVETAKLWPTMLWFQELQMILEDEKMGLEQALVKGWRWFMNPESYGVRSMGLVEYALGWQGLDAVKQARFLEMFKINAKALKEWTSSVESMTLRDPEILMHEMSV